MGNNKVLLFTVTNLVLASESLQIKVRFDIRAMRQTFYWITGIMISLEAYVIFKKHFKEIIYIC